MVIEKLRKNIKETLKKLKLPETQVELEHPAEEDRGDYATNVAMILAGRVKRNPRELADEIVSNLQQNKELATVVSKIEVAGPGFINFWLSKKYLVSQAAEAVEKKEAFGSIDYYKDKKIMVEYTDPNPFKEFHIGHLYSNLIGESLANIFEVLGAKVWRADFYGDVGMHVAKSVWGMMKKMKDEKIILSQLEKKSVKERQKFLGECYSLGVHLYKKDEHVREEIKELNYFIYVASQEILIKDKNWKPIVDYKQYIKGRIDRLKQIKPVYEAGLKWSLAYFEQIYKRLGTKFDGYYPESWTGELGMKLVEKGLKRSVLDKSNGAVIYRGEQDGLHTRVFVNKLGLPTYEAKDLGLAQAKYQDFQYDLSINVFGKEIDEYYKVVLAALKKIRPELGNKSTHIAHGMVNLPEGKMSSRTGNVITVEWLLDQTKKQALKVMVDSDLSKSEKEKIVEIVAQSAVKYAFLKNNIGGSIVFDFGSSVTLKGESGPYLQYTYARCKSVLRKVHYNNETMKEFVNLTINPEELAILRTVYKFPEVVLEAGKTYSPNLICNFLFDLAQRYNSFYNKHKIIGGENEKLGLTLTAATAQVLKNGLTLLGIKTLEKM